MAAPCPQFEALKPHKMSDGKVQFCEVAVPPNRYALLEGCWMQICTLICEQMKIDMRMNLEARKVELKTRADTPDVSNVHKCANFVYALTLGFGVADAVALLHMDGHYVDSRAILMLLEDGGRGIFAIEKSTRTPHCAFRLEDSHLGIILFRKGGKRDSE